MFSCWHVQQPRPADIDWRMQLQHRCVCVYVCVLCVCTYVCVCAHTCVCVFIHTCVCVGCQGASCNQCATNYYSYVCARVCRSVCVRVCVFCHTCVCMYVCVFIYVCAADVYLLFSITNMHKPRQLHGDGHLHMPARYVFVCLCVLCFHTHTRAHARVCNWTHTYVKMHTRM